VVFVVFVSDIERRVGEDKVGKRFFDFTEDFYTVAAYYSVEQFLHGDMLNRKEEKRNTKYDMRDLGRVLFSNYL